MPNLNKLLLKNYLSDALPESDFSIWEPGELLPAAIESRCPWPSIFDSSLSYPQAVDEMWARSPLKNFRKTLLSKLQSVAMLEEQDSGDLFLLYVLHIRGSLSCYIAKEPSPLALTNPALRDDLNQFYSLHDGFWDLDDDTTGFQRSSDFQWIPSEPNGRTGFMSVFQVGANIMGFEVDDRSYAPRIIWSSAEEIEEVEDFWYEADSWLCSQFEDYDESQ